MRDGHVEGEKLASQLLDEELAARPGTALVAGRVAPVVDPLGRDVYRPLLPALDARRTVEGRGGTASAAGEPVVGLDPRFFEEVAYAADRPDVLIAALRRWPDAPFGEFLARAAQRRSLTFCLAIAEAALGVGGLQWVDEPDRTTWVVSKRGSNMRFAGE